MIPAIDALHQAANALGSTDIEGAQIITSVRLVYAPQSEEGARKSPGSGSMVPVWRFVCIPDGRRPTAGCSNWKRPLSQRSWWRRAPAR